jgi:hypothetical protein
MVSSTVPRTMPGGTGVARAAFSAAGSSADFEHPAMGARRLRAIVATASLNSIEFKVILHVA